MPTLVCIPIMVRDSASALADARLARDLGADLVEFRVDASFDPDEPSSASSVVRLARECPLACIVTCRSAREGGEYAGDENARRSLYLDLAGANAARYIDVEAADCGPWLAPPGGDATTLIASFHDFAGRPADLARRVLAMRGIPGAGVLKIAFTARSVRENLECFELVREAERPTIALAMGEHGLMSRVLAPKFGAFLTFASLRPASATAPGQPTIHDLLHTYRFRSIGRRTRVFGVIAWPVGHSLSPLVHNAVFDAAGEDAVYLPLGVPGGSEAPEALKATLAEFIHDPHLDFSGASVSLPHKENLLRLALASRWEVSDAARALGAANTLSVLRDSGGHVERVRVDNTDAPAILDALGPRVTGRSLDDPTGPPLAGVVGAGGVARAAAWALRSAGFEVFVANRTAGRAHALAADLGVAACERDDLASRPLRVIVNATSVGMKGGPDPGGTPLDVSRLPADCIVLDTVYSPLETPLLRAAGARGLRVVDGAAVFVAQAARQSELWLGRTPPMSLMDRVVREALEVRAPPS